MQEPLFLICFLVFKTMNWCRNASGTGNKVFTSKAVYRHDRCITKQPAKLCGIANTFSMHRNQAHRCRLLIYHSNRHFIGNNTCNCCVFCISRNSDHIKSYRAYTGHRFQFFQRQRTIMYRIDHPLVFADRNKGTTEPPHIRGRHRSR